VELIHGATSGNRVAYQNQGCGIVEWATAGVQPDSLAHENTNGGSMTAVSSFIRTVTVGSGLSPDLLTPFMLEGALAGSPVYFRLQIKDDIKAAGKKATQAYMTSTLRSLRRSQQRERFDLKSEKPEYRRWGVSPRPENKRANHRKCILPCQQLSPAASSRLPGKLRIFSDSSRLLF
jgi:hypothetical protein